jgi:integrating conjugative element protein (TIGR03765 family)
VISALVLTAVLMAQTEHVLGPTRARDVEAPVELPEKPVPDRFPMRTTLTLKGANPPKIQLRFGFARPICVVGTDAHSAQWLTANLAALTAGGALCYVVGAESESSVSKVQAIAPKLSLTAIPDGVFIAAGLRGYPAIINRSGAVR